MAELSRPEAGDITVRELRIKICVHCGSVISGTGLCDYHCNFDGEVRTARDFFTAVYERTDKFIRDEISILPGTAEPAAPLSAPKQKGSNG